MQNWSIDEKQHLSTSIDRNIERPFTGFFCALLRLTTAKQLSQKPEFWAHRPEFFWRNPEFFRRIDLSFFSLRPKFFGE